MTKKDKEVVAKLVRHMQGLQRQITKPTAEDATDEEVLKLFKLFWEWTPNAKFTIPSKHAIENLVGLMRGFDGYCYINRQDVARIIRAKAASMEWEGLSIHLCKDADKMTDVELYEDGKWNYKPTAFVDMLLDLHHKQGNFRFMK